MDNMKNSKPLILIVDDEVVNLRVIANLLESDYEIAISTSGQRAIELAHQTPQPSLILLDILMEGMNGYQVCKKLKKSQQCAGIPIIFLTTKGKEKDEAKGFEMGAVDFITKPFRPMVDLKRIALHIKLDQQIQTNKFKIDSNNKDKPLQIETQLKELYGLLSNSKLSAEEKRVADDLLAKMRERLKRERKEKLHSYPPRSYSVCKKS